MNTRERERHEEAQFLSERATPRSEQRRSAWGSLLMAVPSHGCPAPKCIKRPNHPGDHWPKEE